MRAVKGSRPQVAARRRSRWARGILAAGLASVPLGLIAQTYSPGLNRNTPYGDPLYGSQGTQSGTTRSDTRRSTDVVDPIAGGDDQPFQPVRITDPDTAASGSASSRQLIGEGQGNALNPRLKPPPRPNEFESYVERATGRELPRFGAGLLLPSNRDYAVPATATVPPAYILNVGDTISISLAGSTDGSVRREIDTDGKIFLPRVGTIRLAGVRYGDLREVIAKAVGRQYRGYEVTVSIPQLRGVRVYVTGFANNPGAYTVNSLSTMVNAVLAAGGPSAGGSFRSVKLYRNGALVSDFDLYEFVRGGDKSRDVVLQNEDVLAIAPLGEQVAVTGSVNEEAIYELKPGETTSSLLAYAGGFNGISDKSRVLLFRPSEMNERGGQEIPATQLAGVQPHAGDIFQVLSIGTLQPSIYRQSSVVRVEGEVVRPGNYVVPANATLGEVMALAGGPTPRAYVFGTRLERTSVRRQQREAFRDAVAQFELTIAAAPLTGDQSIDAGSRQTQLAGAQAVLERLREAEPDGRVVLELPPEAQALPASLLVENNDRILIPARASTVGVFGAVFRPASFLFNEGKPGRVRDYLAKAGGPIRAGDRGNLFVVRANGEVLAKRNGALNARVLPGDVIFMPVKTQTGSVLAKIRELTTIVSQIGFTAAALAVIDR